MAAYILYYIFFYDYIFSIQSEIIATNIYDECMDDCLCVVFGKKFCYHFLICRKNIVENICCHFLILLKK